MTGADTATSQYHVHIEDRSMVVLHQVLVLSEIHTRPVEAQPEVTFTFYASFIVTCFIYRQQLATFHHTYIFVTNSFQLT